MSSGSGAVDFESVQQETRTVIHSATSADSPLLIEAPPAAGKTTAAFELVHVGEQPVTYLAERTDLYHKAEKWIDDEPTVNGAVIPSPQRKCPTFKGDNDGELAKAEQLYSKGVSGAQIHYNTNVYTPCHSEQDPCQYMEDREEIERGLENNSIDLLIGNHKHAYNEKYITDRIVVFDEFNPGQFLERFPSNGQLDGGDHPGDIIPSFLSKIQKSGQEFPTEVYQDLTDLIQNRIEHEPLEAALEWFEEHGVTRSDVKNYDFYTITTYRHNSTHRRAPLLTLALLSMRKIGSGVELAPPPEDHGFPRIRDAWNNSGLNDRIRVLRDRNTGELFLLRPPDTASAAQVLGLDAFPPKSLWDLIFAPEAGFDHRTVLKREDLVRYLNSALNMTVKQLGQGRYPYAGGRISDFDEYRFAVIHSLEGRRFPLISTKKALEEYESRSWLKKYVKRTPEGAESNEFDNDFAVLNFAKTRSSNVFEKEDLGVVSGSGFPGYGPLKIWAGFCGEAVTIPDENEDPSFTGTADEVYQYLSNQQVLQAILRFGRHKSVYANRGSTVYVNTEAVPDWFDPDEKFELEHNSKPVEIIEYLIKAARTDARKPLPEQNCPSLMEAVDCSEQIVRDTLQTLEQYGLVTTSDRGRAGSTLYRWDGDSQLQDLKIDAESSALPVGENVYILDL